MVDQYPISCGHTSFDLDEYFECTICRKNREDKYNALEERNAALQLKLEGLFKSINDLQSHITKLQFPIATLTYRQKVKEAIQYIAEKNAELLERLAKNDSDPTTLSTSGVASNDCASSSEKDALNTPNHYASDDLMDGYVSFRGEKETLNFLERIHNYHLFDDIECIHCQVNEYCERHRND